MGSVFSAVGRLIGGDPGKGDRREAARIRQEAFDYTNDIRLPTLEELSIKPSDIQYYQVTGKFTPELLQAVQMDKTLLEDLEQNPQFVRDQLQIVESKKRRIAEGGLTAQDRAAMNQILRETERQSRAQQETIGARLRERGAAGSPVEALMRLKGQAQTADTASEQAFRTAALGAASRLQEEATLSDMLGRMSREDLTTKEARARAQAEREKLNVGLRSQADIMNIQTRNLAQAQALANQQRVAEQNVALRNMITQQNVAAQQQALQNQMQKAGLLSGAAGTQAGALEQDAARKAAEQSAKWGAIGGLVDTAIGTGTTLFTGASKSAPPSGEYIGQASPQNYNLGNYGAQLGQFSALPTSMTAFASDKNLKKDVKESKKHVDEMLEKLKPYTFKYKNSKHGEGDRVGVMAQDLERSKMGKTLVKDTPEGKAIDIKNAIGAVMASQARIMEKLKKLEKAQDKKGK
jgi:hypothetical protein